jgi:hypothetical protein
MTIHHTSQELKSLKRIEELLTVLAKTALNDAFEANLKDKKHRVLYELTGQLSVKELSRKTAFSVGKISGLWQKWEQAGLLIKHGGQYKKIF